MDYLEYKGYKGSVEYSKDLTSFLFGKVQGLSKELTPTHEGQQFDELGARILRRALESFLIIVRGKAFEPAKPYSNKLNLRMPSELHSRVAAFVASTGITIKRFHQSG